MRKLLILFAILTYGMAKAQTIPASDNGPELRWMFPNLLTVVGTPTQEYEVVSGEEVVFRRHFLPMETTADIRVITPEGGTATNTIWFPSGFSAVSLIPVGDVPDDFTYQVNRTGSSIAVMTQEPGEIIDVEVHYVNRRGTASGVVTATLVFPGVRRSDLNRGMDYRSVYVDQAVGWTIFDCNDAATNVISVTNSGTITDLDLHVQYFAESLGYVDIFLRSPEGTTALIVSGISSIEEANFDYVFDQDQTQAIIPREIGFHTFTGTFAPVASSSTWSDGNRCAPSLDSGNRRAVGLDVFDGENMMGDWTIYLLQAVSSDHSGRLDYWGLNIDTQ